MARHVGKSNRVLSRPALVKKMEPMKSLRSLTAVGKSVKSIVKSPHGSKVLRGATGAVVEKNAVPGSKRTLQPPEKQIKVSVKSRRTVGRLPKEEEEHGGKRAQLGMMTILEKRSVSKEVELQYTAYQEMFKSFCTEQDLPWPPLAAVDTDIYMADMMDWMFLQGKSSNEGEKVLAAVEYGFIHLKGKMPRSRKALRGWRKEMPPESRLPAPMLMVYGLAMALASLGEKEMGLKVLTDFDCYLRPGEGLSLLARNIIPPVAAAGPQYQTFCLVVKEFEQGVPDKVGIFDTSIPLDSKGRQWLGEMLFQLATKRQKKDGPLFSFSADQFRKKFRLAAKKMGVGHLHPYQLRHGGASEDLNSRSRDYAGVKQRGRRGTDKSVRRYTKVGRVQQLLNQLSPEMLEYCRWSLRNMERVMTGQMIPRKI